MKHMSNIAVLITMKNEKKYPFTTNMYHGYEQF